MNWLCKWIREETHLLHGVLGLLLILLIAATVQHVVQEVKDHWLELFYRRLSIRLSAEYRTALLRLLEIRVIWAIVLEESGLASACIDRLRLDEDLVSKLIVAL